jgi:hypothetical protein
MWIDALKVEKPIAPGATTKLVHEKRTKDHTEQLSCHGRRMTEQNTRNF